MNESDGTRLAIVVEELVTNLYEHGGLSDEDEFDLELSCANSAVRLVLTAPGQPFDPTLGTAERAVPERGGGAGLKLVRAWACEMDYQTGGGHNRLALQLPLSDLSGSWWSRGGSNP